MREIHMEITINAKPEKIWEVLTNLPRYAEWNPVIFPASGIIGPVRGEIFQPVEGGRANAFPAASRGGRRRGSPQAGGLCDAGGMGDPGHSPGDRARSRSAHALHGGPGLAVWRGSGLAARAGPRPGANPAQTPCALRVFRPGRCLPPAVPGGPRSGRQNRSRVPGGIGHGPAGRRPALGALAPGASCPARGRGAGGNRRLANCWKPPGSFRAKREILSFVASKNDKISRFARNDIFGR
jgi:hypothetical protein